MKKILIVDDSTMTLSVLEKSLLSKLDDIEIISARSYKDGLKAVLQYGKDISFAIIDLHLPDSKDGAMLDIIESNGIKSIVLSNVLDEQSKEQIFGKNYIIDCIAKNGEKSIKSVVTAANREIKNGNKNILLVDDSKMQIAVAQKILKKINLNVVTANDGQEALDIVEKAEVKFSLVLTDYHMPVMDGMELTFKLREKYDKDELGIIVFSTNNTPEVAAEFLKIGANDFINKPFLETEVITRINANLDLIDLFKETKDLANKDFLTGLYNRRFFFEGGTSLIAKSKRTNNNLALAMVDIDFFKKINDTYGHEVGDIAICEVGEIFNTYLRESDLVARFGGEEFCILIDNITLEDTQKLFEKIRFEFEKNILKIGDLELKFTVSIGVFYGLSDCLEDMIRISDECLYECKNNGRNQIFIKDMSTN
jgi:diguanylate cyclase (GGDEF)-like protein